MWVAALLIFNMYWQCFKEFSVESIHLNKGFLSFCQKNNLDPSCFLKAWFAKPCFVIVSPYKWMCLIHEKKRCARKTTMTLQKQQTADPHYCWSPTPLSSGDFSLTVELPEVCGQGEFTLQTAMSLCTAQYCVICWNSVVGWYFHRSWHIFKATVSAKLAYFQLYF